MNSGHGLLAVKTKPGMITIVKIHDIISLRAAGNYVEIFVEEGRLLHRATLQSVFSKMPDVFIQVHRRHVINLEHLHLLQSELGRYTECVMSDGQQIRIGAQYKTKLMATLDLLGDDKS